MTGCRSGSTDELENGIGGSPVTNAVIVGLIFDEFAATGLGVVLIR
jgi:hypothetical protein